METLTATTIFWLLSLGLTVGWLFGIYLGREGRSINANMIWGTTGALVAGLLGLALELGDVLLFAFMGSLATLFLVNVFHQHHEEDLFGNADRGIIIKRKSRKERKGQPGL